MKKPSDKKRSPRERSQSLRSGRAATTNEDPPATFNGRRIIEIDWRGAKAGAVEGLFVYRTSQVDRVLPPQFEGPDKTRVSPLGNVDRLGIGVLLIEGDFDLGIADKLSPFLGLDIEWVEPVLTDHLAAAPNDPDFRSQWGLEAINAEGGWGRWSGNPDSVILAVLDSGLPLQLRTLSHQDLNDPARFLLGPDLVNNDNDPADDHGHGTHVLGIAAATRNNHIGIAGLWHGPAFVAKVFNGRNRGTSTTFKNGVFCAIDFAEGRGAKLVINYSGAGPDCNTKKLAVAEAQRKGALLVAPSGNDNADSVSFPAAYSIDFDNVIGVAGITISRDRAPISNRGKGLTVAAPAIDIYSTTPDYEVFLNVDSKYASLSGTSMASAFVSGVAALVWSKSHNLTAAEVRERIASTARAVPRRENEFGRGIIDADKALT